MFTKQKNVRITFDNLLWAINPNTTIKNNDMKQMIASPIKIKADSTTFIKKSNQMLFKGNVEVIQKKFKISCDTMLYDINNEMIYFNDNVIISKFGIKYLTSTKLIVNIKKETFITKSPNKLSEIKLDI